jgi:hypothetical protein
MMNHCPYVCKKHHDQRCESTHSKDSVSRYEDEFHDAEHYHAGWSIFGNGVCRWEVPKLVMTKPKRIPIWCEYGLHVWFTDTLEDLVELMRDYNRFIRKVDPSAATVWEEEARKQGAEEFIGPSKSKLQGLLDQEGFLTIACLECNASVSQEMYRRLGVETYKVGIVLYNPKLIDEPKVQEEVRKYGLNRQPYPIDFNAILGPESPPYRAR